MDRIYMNRIPGSERIHVEIAENEVADLLDDLRVEDPEWFDATKKLHALLVRASKDFGHTHRDTEAVATAAAAEPVRSELWSLLDWTFWGSGMGDVFREPLADTMLAAISPEQRKQAEQLIEAWHASGRQPLGRRRYEELNAELKAARQMLGAGAGDQASTRTTVEYFLQTQQEDGTWGEGSSFDDDREWMIVRLGKRRRQFSQYEHRIAQRTTTVAVGPVTLTPAEDPR